MTVLDTLTFGPGIGLIWLSSVQCIGNESYLVDCQGNSGLSDYRCDHSDDAAVRCGSQESEW